MAQRHKAIKATLDVGSATEWNDDHIVDFSDELDFEYSPLSQLVADIWDTAQTAGGSAPAVAFTDHHTGVYFVTGATTDQTSSMRLMLNGGAGNTTYIDDAPILTFALWLDVFHTAGNVAEFGLITSATALFTANQNGAYFRIEDNALYSVCGTGAAETATDITPTGGIPEYGVYKIELGSANCKFFVDDMETPARTETSNLPTGDVTLKFSIRSKNNVDSKMYLDGVALKRVRYAG